ncbi:MAG: hypothetical protein CM15mP106_4730 [Candidatus Neomarinimicrobiota bacterium]|nr:MAG: hypothetical protein CM15mP106_4730 [Candidatus Neomarinimicrobiota bacterium]
MQFSFNHVYVCYLVDVPNAGWSLYLLFANVSICHKDCRICLFRSFVTVLHLLFNILVNGSVFPKPLEGVQCGVGKITMSPLLYLDHL